jgi:hypothetical protein
MLGRMKQLWIRFLATTRLSEDAICEASKLRGPDNDFHDYPDSDQGPWHFSDHYCNRCNKMFHI